MARPRATQTGGRSGKPLHAGPPRVRRTFFKPVRNNQPTRAKAVDQRRDPGLAHDMGVQFDHRRTDRCQITGRQQIDLGPFYIHHEDIRRDLGQRRVESIALHRHGALRLGSLIER